MSRTPHVLIVDDDDAVAKSIEKLLHKLGHHCTTAPSAEAAQRRVGETAFDLVVTDHRLPGRSGIDFLRWLGEHHPDMPTILVTGYGSIEHAVEAMRAGASDYLTKPVDLDALRTATGKALAIRGARRIWRDDPEEVRARGPEEEIVGDSKAMRSVMGLALKVADTSCPVLIEGETGTGKEIFARFIHESSSRRGHPFESVNCAAIPSELMESELFGHEPGAFTGATERRRGYLELAGEGTLLLDEISEMPLSQQSKLLRVLQENRFRRLGGEDDTPLGARIIATSNQSLQDAVAQGQFRKDLYYRLNVVRIRIPSLSERPEDIPVMAEAFVRRYSRLEKRSDIQGLERAAIERLVAHGWPGNVRELQHTIHRAVLMSDTPMINAKDLDLEAPLEVEGEPSEPGNALRSGSEAGNEMDGPVVLPSLDVRKAKQILVEVALQRSGGNRTQAAKALGMSPRGLRAFLNQGKKGAGVSGE